MILTSTYMPRFRRANAICWVYVFILTCAGLWIGLWAFGAGIPALQDINLFHNLGVDVSTPKNVFASWGEHFGVGSGWTPDLEDRYASRPHLPSNPPLAPLENGDEELTSDEQAASGVNSDVTFEDTRLKLSDTVFPDLDRSDSWSNENNKAIRDLFRCIELENCVENQEKVVILGSFHFRGALSGWVGGEDIWSRSSIMALQSLNYTLLYSLNNDRAVQLYQMFPALVVAVLFEASDVVVCHRDTENCIQSERNPHGIPIHKLFSWHFWSQPAHPLGSHWTWQPEPYAIEGYFPDVTYVGYSVEPSCTKQPFIPHEERAISFPSLPALDPSQLSGSGDAIPPPVPPPHTGKGQAYLLAKHLYYFTDEIEHGWSPTVWKRVKEETGLELIIGSRGEDDGYEQPEGLTNLGFMPQERFLNEVAKSRVLIGVGQPYTSPTPYEALCLGVPFINPILNWDPENPSDKSRWSSQHVILRYLDPPYVYNVHKDDEQGLIDAINAAYENPIDSFVLDRMRIPAIAERLGELLGTDWEELAKTVPLNPMDGW